MVCQNTNQAAAILPQPDLYSRRESNPNRWNRNPIFYPLNYGNMGDGDMAPDLQCKGNAFLSTIQIFFERLTVAQPVRSNVDSQRTEPRPMRQGNCGRRFPRLIFASMLTQTRRRNPWRQDSRYRLRWGRGSPRDRRGSSRASAPLPRA